MAVANPARTQNSTVAALVPSSRTPGSGYVSTAANPRPARSSQMAATSVPARPAPRASAVAAMQVITAGSGAAGRRGYSSRTRCARGYAESGPNWA